MGPQATSGSYHFGCKNPQIKCQVPPAAERGVMCMMNEVMRAEI